MSDSQNVSGALLHVDLGAGNGGWQSATEPSDRWRTVGIDIRRLPGVDVQADLRALPLDCSPDLLTMSPPCTEFARWMLPWCDEPDPDLSLVKACLDAVEELRPRWWVLENSRGLSMYWREARTNIGPYYLWGEWPPMDVDASPLPGKMQTSGSDPEGRAEIPHALSAALKGAVETYTTPKVVA
jgi:hypothetical protein